LICTRRESGVHQKRQAAHKALRLQMAVEAADNGLLEPELAAGIARIKGVKSKGVRVGNWLSIGQAQNAFERSGRIHQEAAYRDADDARPGPS
jgi:hypothetical protein